MTHKTREGWLLEAADLLRQDFEAAGDTVPPFRVSVGWPKGSRGGRQTVIGQCFSGALVADNIPAVFVSPALGNAQDALAVLAHEMVHATHPEAGHKGEFKRLATAIGLEGKMTATHAGDALKERLAAIVDQLGEYPHAAVNGDARKKQSTRMLKAECGPCGYIVRLSRKAAEYGLPSCPCGDTMELAS